MIWRHFLLLPCMSGGNLVKYFLPIIITVTSRLWFFSPFSWPDLDMTTTFPGDFCQLKKDLFAISLNIKFYNFCHQRFGSGVNGQWLGMLTVGSGVVLLLCLLSAKLTGDTITWKTVGFFEFIMSLLLIC